MIDSKGENVGVLPARRRKGSKGENLIGARALLLALATGCGGGAKEVPLWEQPGLYGAVRPEMGSPQPGDLAPAFDLPIDGGGTFRGASLRGTWTLLHFTASWCPYCDAEVEHLGALATEYGPRGVKVVLIDVEEGAERWTSYATSHVAKSVIALRDGSGDVARRFAPPHAQPSFTDRAQVALDATLILDPEWKIRLFLFPDSKHFDPSFASVKRVLDRLLAEEESSPSPLLAPERVVAVDAQAASAATGRREVVVSLRIAPGYHLMSDRPSAPEYIPTEIAFPEGGSVTWGKPSYPAAAPFRLAEKSIATFQGVVEVRVPFDVAAESATVRRSIAGTLRYQACTPTSCLFPVTRAFAVEIP
jgi:peroxiredoxin